MAEGMNLPSMFDTQYAMGRQMEEDAYKAGQLPLGGGMMYASSMKGDLENAQLMSLAGMMGGKGDPRMEKQKIIERVMQEFGKQPETIEDYIAVANLFNGYGEHGFAEQAMDQARELQKDTKKTYTTETIGVMKDGKRYTQTWQFVNGQKTTKLGEYLTSEPAKAYVERDPEKIAFNKWHAENSTATAAEITAYLADDKDMEARLLDLLDLNPDYIKAVADKDGTKQADMILGVKKQLTDASQADPTTVQIQKFTESYVDEDGNEKRRDVWKSLDFETKKWTTLSTNVHDMKALTTRSYLSDIDGKTWEISEEWDGSKWVQFAKTDKTDVPDSFESAIVKSVMNTAGYNELDTTAKAALLKTAKDSISIPKTETAINAAYRDINADFIKNAQEKLKSEADPDFMAKGTTTGNKEFFEWKNALDEAVAKAGGNTEVGEVLAQYKLWEDISRPSLDSLDQMTNLKDLIELARSEGVDDPNSAAWASATRFLVSLTKDSNLSLAEVKTVSQAGSVPRKIVNWISQFGLGVATDATINDFEEIAIGLERVLIDRYNKNHDQFNESFTLAKTDPALLKGITGERLVQIIPPRLANPDNIRDQLVANGVLIKENGKYFYADSGLPLE